MDLRIIVPRNVAFGTCPKCKEEMTMERVKASGKFEKFFLSLFRFKKYHCKSCKWYGTLFIYAITRNFKKVMINYLIITATILLGSLLISLFVRKVLVP
jgi:hypothetical protein